MIGAVGEEAIAVVTSEFRVDAIGRTPKNIQFRILDEGSFKRRFADLARRLEAKDFLCRAEVVNGRLFVQVVRMKPGGSGRRRWLAGAWVPRLLFAAVVAFVMVDGYYRTLDANAVVHVGDPLEMAAAYTLALLGILGAHEAGHLAASRLHGIRTSWPYFIPGIPVVAIPTFGAFIRSRSLTINREILFDIAVAGPVAGLAVAVLVALYAAHEAPMIPPELAALPPGESGLAEWSHGQPLLMAAALAAFGKGGEGQDVLFTPLMFAAWLGFLITFLNMLPAWQLDGGHMARTMMGEKRHRYATFASLGVLALLNYWMMALLILALSSRNPAARPLDDVSPLPRGRRRSYAAVVAMAVLCAPLPSYVLP